MFREFPCKFDHFYVFFTPWDARLVQGIRVKFYFEATHIQREFTYTFDEFNEMTEGADQNMSANLIQFSVAKFYSDTNNLHKQYFKIYKDEFESGTETTNSPLKREVRVGGAVITICYPHIEQCDPCSPADTPIKLEPYRELFGQICGQINIINQIQGYVKQNEKPCDVKERLKGFYYPY